jgi:hypothetical protein
MEYRKFVGRVNVCYDECFDFLKKISFLEENQLS